MIRTRAPATLWTLRHRRALGRLFDAAEPDPERAFALTRECIAALRRVLPSAHDGIELVPLLEHKLAGYNADLFAQAARLLRADAGAGAFLARHDPRRVAFPFPDMYLAEHCLAARLERSGGVFAARCAEVRSREVLARRYGARCADPAYEPLEIALGDGAGAHAGPAGAAEAPAFPRDGVVLFVASMNNYLNPMAPVMRAVSAMGLTPVALLPAESRAWPGLSQIPGDARRVLVPGPETATAARVFALQRERYAKEWERRAGDLRRCFVVEGVDLWPVVARDIERFVRDYFPYAIACVELARELTDRLGVGSAAVARLRRATECALAAGFRSRAVPVTMIMHGHISNFPERRFDAGSFSGADRVCVWGASQARQVMASPWPPAPGAVSVVGNPAWDGLISGPARDRAALRRSLGARLGLDRSMLWAVYTGQNLALREFGSIVGAFSSAPRAALIVKVHPAEDPAWYRERLAGLDGARVVGHGEVDLHDLLCAADLTLTFSSTTNLESLLLGTPVVTFVFGSLAAQDRAVYLEDYGLPLVRSADELAGLLQTAAGAPDEFRRRYEPVRRRALRETLANSSDGAAARRVAELIMSQPATVTARA